MAFILTLLFTIASTLTGSLFSFFFKDRITALVALMFYSMPTFLMSGYSWPSFALPKGVELVSWLVPLTHFGQSLRQVLLNPQVDWRHITGSIYSLMLFICFAGLLNFLFVLKKSRREARSQLIQ